MKGISARYQSQEKLVNRKSHDHHNRDPFFRSRSSEIVWASNLLEVEVWLVVVRCRIHVLFLSEFFWAKLAHAFLFNLPCLGLCGVDQLLARCYSSNPSRQKWKGNSISMSCTLWRRQIYDYIAALTKGFVFFINWTFIMFFIAYYVLGNFQSIHFLLTCTHSTSSTTIVNSLLLMNNCSSYITYILSDIRTCLSLLTSWHCKCWQHGGRNHPYGKFRWRSIERHRHGRYGYLVLFRRYRILG